MSHDYLCSEVVCRMQHSLVLVCRETHPRISSEIKWESEKVRMLDDAQDYRIDHSSRRNENEWMYSVETVITKDST